MEILNREGFTYDTRINPNPSGKLCSIYYGFVFTLHSHYAFVFSLVGFRSSSFSLSLTEMLALFVMSSKEVTTGSRSGDASSRRWWDEEIDMFWELKERMQRMDDLGAEISQMLVEFLLAIYDSENDSMVKKFQNFLWFMWLPLESGDRVMTRKVFSLLEIGNKFMAELTNKREKKAEKNKPSKPLALTDREFEELVDGLNGGLHKIQWILAFLQESLREPSEDSLEALDCRLEQGRKSLEELKPKIEGLKKASRLFSEYSSEIQEFWKGEMEQEMSRLWNTSWELEDEVVGEYIVWSPHPVKFK